MRAGRYWAREDIAPVAPDGTTYPRSFRAPSDVSRQDAKRNAQILAEEYAKEVERGRVPDWSYEYERRSKPEPVVQSIDHEGERVGLITVNAYGARVLNCPRVTFIDVDAPEPRRPGFFARLFGGGKRDAPADSPLEACLQRLHAQCRANPSSPVGAGVRVYRTAGGLRYLLTRATLDPSGGDLGEHFEPLRADPRYTTLCAAQRCFRARLTPKPSRLRCGWPPVKFHAEHEPTPELKDWERRYTEESAGHAVCELLETHGSPPEHPHILAVQALHDELTGVGSGLPLA